MESLFDVFGRVAVGLHSGVTLGLSHGTAQGVLYVIFGESTAIGSIGLILLLLGEGGLQVVAQMCDKRFLCILLHMRVDAGVDTQSIGGKIVVRTIWFLVLVAPTIEWIGLPGEGIVVELLILPRCVA